MSSTTTIGYSTSTNGLSLYLDADNPRSYPGTGTTWYDLSTGVNNSSTALATYNNTSPTSFSIPPGPSNYIEFTSSAITTSTCSIEIIFKPTVFTNGGYYNILFFTGLYNFVTPFSIISLSPAIPQPTTNFIYFFSSGLTYGNAFYGTSAVSVIDQWQYWVFELYSGQTFNNNKMYLNGNLLTLNGSFSETSTNFNNGSGRIYGDASISCSIFRIYDRTLTQQEITNNYNYFKPFYNLS